MVISAATVALGCGTASTTTHSLQLAYQSSPASTAAATVNPIVSLLTSDGTTGEGADCLQQDAPAAAVAPRGKFVVNRFYVAAKDGINELHCAGSGNATGQPIARGVEEFVLRYQLSQPGATPTAGNVGVAAGGSQARYVNATDVSDTTVNPVGWANVSAVEICLVIATPSTSGSAAGTAQIQTSRPTCARTTTGAFAANVTRTAGDSRLWKRFTSVISVRNAIYASAI
jgi:type IV pilus assembly protein PilW